MCCFYVVDMYIIHPRSLLFSLYLFLYPHLLSHRCHQRFLRWQLSYFIHHLTSLPLSPPPLLVLPLYSLSLHLPSSTTLILSPSLTLFPKSFPTSTTTSSPSSSPSPSFPLSLHLSPHPPLLYFFISPPFLSPGHC